MKIPFARQFAVAKNYQRVIVALLLLFASLFLVSETAAATTVGKFKTDSMMATSSDDSTVSCDPALDGMTLKEINDLGQSGLETRGIYQAQMDEAVLGIIIIQIPEEPATALNTIQNATDVAQSDPSNVDAGTGKVPSSDPVLTPPDDAPLTQQLPVDTRPAEQPPIDGVPQMSEQSEIPSTKKFSGFFDRIDEANKYCLENSEDDKSLLVYVKSRKLNVITLDAPVAEFVDERGQSQGVTFATPAADGTAEGFA